MQRRNTVASRPSYNDRSEVKVKLLRSLFTKQVTKLDGYIITSGDQHSGDIVAYCDRRLEYMTGYSGPTGRAIVTFEEAYLWMNGQHNAQAADEVQLPFQIKRRGSSGTPLEWEWLLKCFPNGGVIGACGKYVAAADWIELDDKLNSFKVQLVDIEEDLVDLIWTNRPGFPGTGITPRLITLTGETTGQKVKTVREAMKKKHVEMLVVSELNDIAWLLNLSGTDIPYNPVFLSFLIVRMTHIDIFIYTIDESVMHHFFVEKVQVCNHCYEEFYESLQEIAAFEEIERIWISDRANYRIYRNIPRRKVYLGLSPVTIGKCVKNNTESSGMIEAHVYDGYALCKFFCWVYSELKKNRRITELSAAQRLEDIRRQNSDYVGPSSATVSASGAHSALPNYGAKPRKDRTLTLEDIYLCGSGAHYLTGTTSVTRTFHFGHATEFQKECYTRIFKGQVSLSCAVFPLNTKSSALDVLARRFLWRAGLDYEHGAGQKVRSFLTVHEGPIRINRKTNNEIGLLTNMFVSNEPSYYADDQFGIRLENVEQVVRWSTKRDVPSTYLTFENITMCPYQSTMLIPSMLTPNEINYLNFHHSKVRKILCPVFKMENNVEVYNWILKMTEPLVS